MGPCVSSASKATPSEWRRIEKVIELIDPLSGSDALNRVPPAPSSWGGSPSAAGSAAASPSPCRVAVAVGTPSELSSSPEDMKQEFRAPRPLQGVQEATRRARAKQLELAARQAAERARRASTPKHQLALLDIDRAHQQHESAVKRRSGDRFERGWVKYDVDELGELFSDSESERPYTKRMMHCMGSQMVFDAPEEGGCCFMDFSDAPSKRRSKDFEVQPLKKKMRRSDSDDLAAAQVAVPLPAGHHGVSLGAKGPISERRGKRRLKAMKATAMKAKQDKKKEKGGKSKDYGLQDFSVHQFRVHQSCVHYYIYYCIFCRAA